METLNSDDKGKPVMHYPYEDKQKVLEESRVEVIYTRFRSLLVAGSQNIAVTAEVPTLTLVEPELLTDQLKISSQRI